MRTKNQNTRAAPLTAEGKLEVESGFQIAYKVYGSGSRTLLGAARRARRQCEVPHAPQRGHRRGHATRPLRPARRRRLRLARRHIRMGHPTLHRRGRDRAYDARARQRHALRAVVGRHARAGLHARAPGQRRRADPLEHVRVCARTTCSTSPITAYRSGATCTPRCSSTSRTARWTSAEYQDAVAELYARYLYRSAPYSSVRSREEFEAIAAEYMPEMGPAYALWGPHEFMGTGPEAHFDISDRLGEITVPTLVLCGWYDELTPSAAAARSPTASPAVSSSSSASRAT